MSAAAPVLIALTAVGALYTALLATRQDDSRRLVAYVSLSQQSLVALALFAATATSLRGAVLSSLAQALIVTALVLVVAALARRASSPLLSRSGGIASSAPGLAGIATFVFVAAAGVRIDWVRAAAGADAGDNVLNAVVVHVADGDADAARDEVFD